MLSRHGDKVTVLESHYHPGGVAHAFDIDGYRFDAGPSLWAGMSEAGTNPLRQILDVLEEEVDWIGYDGWGMHIPEGYFRFRTGPDAFVEEIRRLGGEDDVRQWKELVEKMRPLLRAAAAIPPLALRGDYWAPLTLLPYLINALRHAGPGVKALQGPFTAVLEGTVKKGSFLFRWLDYLSFALSGLPADGTMAAAVIYTIGDLHRPGCIIDYPRGGGGAVIAAMVRGIEKFGGRVELRSHVEEIIVEGGRAVGVKLRSGNIVRARKAVVSNASIWDTIRLIPKGAVDAKYIEDSDETPDTGSFMHLHLGIDARGLDDLDIHYSVVDSWSIPIDAPQNMFVVSIPTVLDPSLAPEGKHLVHIYTAGNEPYDLWQGVKRGCPEYEKLKKERAECMWKALEKIIPDVRRRTEVELVATPLTHEFFNRRFRGSYGPGWRAGQAEFPGCITPLKGLLHCGDSTLPGIGLPAVAASGMNAASTLTPVWKQLGLLWDMKRRGMVDSKFNDF
uniref:Prolycopene isomerase-like1 n=1 Tax=Sargassum integerrimum TaxID=1159339 RepID=A0A2D2AH38_9PHAE|nr:prolycopene isomerase-like1 [Sargassum integerrimum]